MRSNVRARIKSFLNVVLVLLIAGIFLPVALIETAAWFWPEMIPAEVKASVFQIDPPFKMLVPDTGLGYKFAPDLHDFPAPLQENHTYPVSTVSLGYNGIGFRDDGLTSPPFAVVVGDSFANCAGVPAPACWVELLEQSSGRDFANLSVLGYGPQQEYRMLTAYGLPLRPQLVLWVFFANDLKDAWRFDRFGSGAARETPFWRNPLARGLVNNSAVFVTGAFFWYNRYFFYNLTRPEMASPNQAWWAAQTNLSIPEVADGLALTQTTIVNAARQTEMLVPGSRLVVILLPFREQVEPPAIHHPNFDAVNAALTNFLTHNNITVIDATPALRAAAAQGSSLYIPGDIHLTPEGNQRAAEFLQLELSALFTAP